MQHHPRPPASAAKAKRKAPPPPPPSKTLPEWHSPSEDDGAIVLDSRDFILEHIFPQIPYGQPAPKFKWMPSKRFVLRKPLFNQADIFSVSDYPDVDLSVEMSTAIVMQWYLHNVHTTLLQQPALPDDDTTNLSPLSFRLFRPKSHANVTLRNACRIARTVGVMNEEQLERCFAPSSFDLSTTRARPSRDLSIEDQAEMKKRCVYAYAFIKTAAGLRFALDNLGPCICTLPNINNKPATTWQPYLPALGDPAEVNQVAQQSRAGYVVVSYDAVGFILRGTSGTQVPGLAIDPSLPAGHLRWPFEHFGLQFEIACFLPPRMIQDSTLVQQLPQTRNVFQLHSTSHDDDNSRTSAPNAERKRRSSILKKPQHRSSSSSKHRRNDDIGVVLSDEDGSDAVSDDPSHSQERSARTTTASAATASTNGPPPIRTTAPSRFHLEEQESYHQEQLRRKKERAEARRMLEAEEDDATGSDDDEDSRTDSESDDLSDASGTSAASASSRRKRNRKSQRNRHTNEEDEVKDDSLLRTLKQSSRLLPLVMSLIATKNGANPTSGPDLRTSAQKKSANVFHKFTENKMWRLFNGLLSDDEEDEDYAIQEGLDHKENRRRQAKRMAPVASSLPKRSKNSMLTFAMRLLERSTPRATSVMEKQSRQRWDKDWADFVRLKAKFAKVPHAKLSHDVVDIGEIVLNHARLGSHQALVQRDVLLHFIDSYSDWMVQEVRNQVHVFFDPENPAFGMPAVQKILTKLMFIFNPISNPNFGRDFATAAEATATAAEVVRATKNHQKRKQLGRTPAEELEAGRSAHGGGVQIEEYHSSSSSSSEASDVEQDRQDQRRAATSARPPPSFLPSAAISSPYALASGHHQQHPPHRRTIPVAASVIATPAPSRPTSRASTNSTRIGKSWRQPD